MEPMDGRENEEEGDGTTVERLGGGCSCCCCCPDRQLSHRFGRYHHVSFAVHHSCLMSDTDVITCLVVVVALDLVLKLLADSSFVVVVLGPSWHKVCGMTCVEQEQKSRSTRQKSHCHVDVFCIKSLLSFQHIILSHSLLL